MVQSGNQERDAVQKIPTAEKKERILVQAVEHLPSQSKALSSNTKTEKKNCLIHIKHAYIEHLLALSTVLGSGDSKTNKNGTC
jgi:phage terminase small subunit